MIPKKEEASKRPARVAAQMRQELARLIGRELGDPRLEGVIVSSVAMTHDLRLARVFFRLMTGDAPAREAAAKALEKASGKLKKAVTDRLKLRFAPELRFAYDEGQEKRDRIDELLLEVETDRKKKK